jgi:hypothetical protein
MGEFMVHHDQVYQKGQMLLNLVWKNLGMDMEIGENLNRNYPKVPLF